MANIFENTLGSKDFKESISNMAKDWALPALLATAGTGAIGGYLASKNRIGHETPNARRKRILRSALFPAATTAAALAALGGSAALADVDTVKIDEAKRGLTENLGSKILKKIVGEHGTETGALIGAGLIPSFTNQPNDPLIRFNVDKKTGDIKPIAQGLKNDFVASKDIKAFLRKLNLRPETIQKINKAIPRFRTSRSPIGVLTGAGLGALAGALGENFSNTVLY